MHGSHKIHGTTTVLFKVEPNLTTTLQSFSEFLKSVIMLI